MCLSHPRITSHAWHDVCVASSRISMTFALTNRTSPAGSSVLSVLATPTIVGQRGCPFSSNIHVRGASSPLMANASDASDHSADENDSEVISVRSGTGTRPAKETQECHFTFPSTHVDGEAASTQPQAAQPKAPTLGAGGRVVRVPCRERDDSGTFGLYCGNWGGHRKMVAAQQHLFQDLIGRNPAQVLAAQEVDPKFARALSHPQRFMMENWHAMSEQLARRLCNNEHWHVIRGTEGDESEITHGLGGGFRPGFAAEQDFHYTHGRGELQDYWFTPTNSKSCMIAARSTIAEAVNVLQWTKQFDGTYKKNGVIKNKYSRLLVAEVIWKQAMAGTRRVVIANVHFHHKTAKQDPCMTNMFTRDHGANLNKSPYSLVRLL